MTRARELAELAAAYDSGGLSNMRNRIINGAMVIDQRNAGAVVSAEGYLVDRWRVWRNQSYNIQQSTDAPTGFSNSLLVTKTSTTQSTYGYLIQYVEGFNFSDMLFGTASAQTVTLSFWVKSSVTGTFSAGLSNSAENRNYAGTYTISAANTWERKTITIPGDTSGTWIGSTSGKGCGVWFNFGASGSGTANAWAADAIVTASTGSANLGTTNNATFQITGVQLEKGSTATSFDVRPYGTELQLCQRYYYRQTPTGTAYYGAGFNDSTTVASLFLNFPVPMRVAPSALEQSGTASNYRVQITGNVINCSAVPALNFADLWGGMVLFTVASGLTAGQASMGRSNSTSGYLGFSAEL